MSRTQTINDDTIEGNAAVTGHARGLSIGSGMSVFNLSFATRPLAGTSRTMRR